MCRSLIQTTLWCISALPLLGCQTYEPKPLDMAAYAQTFQARDLTNETVREFVERIAATRTDADEKTAFRDATLTLEEAETIALCFNPGLRTERARAHVALAVSGEAGRLDNPQLDTNFLYNLDSGGERWLIDVGVAFTIPLSGRLSIRKDQAKAEYGAAWRELVAKEWDLLTNLRQEWYRWSATEGQVRFLREYIEEVDGVVETGKRLVAGGEMTPTALRFLEIKRARRRAELIGHEATSKRQQLALRQRMGLVPDSPHELRIQVVVAPDPESEDLARQALLRHPLLEVVRADYEVAEQTLRLEIAKQIPDLTLGPSYEFDQGASRIGWLAGIPLPIFNLNQEAIARAFAEREQSRAEAEVAYESLRSRLARGQIRRDAAAQQWAVIDQEILPMVRTQVAEVTRLLELGEADLFLAQEAYVSRLELNFARIDAALERAIGAEIVSSLSNPRWSAPAEFAPHPEPEENHEDEIQK